MTENTMAPATESYDAENGSKKKLVFVAGGVAGALVLGAAGYLLLGGGGSSEEEAFSPVKRAPKTAPAKTTTLKSKVPSTSKVPAASSVRIGRDPFKALYVVPDAPKTGAAGAATGTTSTPTDGTATGTGTGSTVTTPNASYVITLTKITSDPGGAKLFTFAIGKTSKTVLPAQRFGNYGELVVLSYVTNSKKVPVAAVVQVGDDNPIKVPIGVKTSVQ